MSITILSIHCRQLNHASHRITLSWILSFDKPTGIRHVLQWKEKTIFQSDPISSDVATQTWAAGIKYKKFTKIFPASPNPPPAPEPADPAV